MLNKLFPFRMYLHILQLEEYKLNRYFTWVSKNFFKRELENKKPLVWTSKAKRIYKISLIYSLLTTVLLIILMGPLGLPVSIFFISQSYFFIALGQLTIRPYEFANRIRVKNRIKKKILKLKESGLIVIGITGSYGKTTTKEYLHKILSTKYSVLKSPESYNTLFGLYKVVDYELDDSYDYFICEMGAYTIGEIKELCDVFLPDHGILIGINEQHVERFGNLKNTIKAKFELIESLPSHGLALLNADNPHIKGNYAEYSKNPIFYGQNNRFSYKNVEIKNGLISCDFYIDSKTIHFEKLNISGEGNLSNALASATMSYLIGINTDIIQKTVAEFTPVSHRLEIKKLHENLILIDDAYSSNVSGFKNALNVLKSFSEYKKIIVTPGIVELGSQTEKIHNNLGKLINEICDIALLVGKNERTVSLSKEINSDKCVFLKSVTEWQNELSHLKNEEIAVLIENDLPDNY